MPTMIWTVTYFSKAAVHQMSCGSHGLVDLMRAIDEAGIEDWQIIKIERLPEPRS